ncbi:trypsin-like serine protease [Mycobacterium hodleri]|nr:trypsin-like serine protease [Mycolicibacterium hodleri]
MPSVPNPRVGAIFLGGQSLHTCSASVVHSTTADLILTAAHCLAAGVEGWFVPAFAESATPQEFWHVDEVYLDPRWVATQDPLADFAVARVSRQGDGSVESVVGFDDRVRAPAGNRRRGDGLRVGRRGSTGRVHGPRHHGPRLPRDSLCRAGRRHQRIAVAGGHHGGRRHRGSRRRRMRRDRLLHAPLRRRGRRAAREGRGRWTGRRRPVSLRRRLLIRP